MAQRLRYSIKRAKEQFEKWEKELYYAQFFCDESEIDYQRYYLSHKSFLDHKVFCLSSDYTDEARFYHLNMCEDYHKAMLNVLKGMKFYKN